jgi:hypothetical protein
MNRLGGKFGRPRIIHSQLSIHNRLVYYSARLRTIRQDILRGDLYAFKELDATWASVNDWLDFFLEDHGGRFDNR